jgi:TonB family protein
MHHRQFSLARTGDPLAHSGLELECVWGHTNQGLPRLTAFLKGASVPILQDEIESPSQLEELTQASLLLPPSVAEEQRKRMLIALGVLLVALTAVVLKDWDFWFPPKAEVEDVTAPTRKASTAVAAAVTSAPAAAVHDRKPVKLAEKTVAQPPLAASAQRTALPDLQVEVVSGNRHISVPPKSNAVHLDLGAEASPPIAKPPASSVISAADRVQLSPQTAQTVTKSVPPDYPLLARQMKVQGAVNLTALISREGTIQELQILSGPTILAAAAREAVRQWRFKPYLQNGEPIETQARITVNFTISTN